MRRFETEGLPPAAARWTLVVEDQVRPLTPLIYGPNRELFGEALCELAALDGEELGWCVTRMIGRLADVLFPPGQAAKHEEIRLARESFMATGTARLAAFVASLRDGAARS